jgi:hypothetical protein
MENKKRRAKLSHRLWSIHEMKAEDAAEIRTLFLHVFQHEMSESLWNWKYAEGRGCALIVRDKQGKLIGHYGGNIRNVLFNGKPVQTMQGVDVMVDHHARGIMTKNGVFSTMTREFADHFYGYDRPNLFPIGFPSDRHMRIGELHKIYVAVDTINEISWPRNDQISLPWWQSVSQLNLSSEEDEKSIDFLWKIQAKDFSDLIIPIRDFKQWKYRFIDHPNIKYDIFILKNKITRKLIGAWVVRVDAGKENSSELLDTLSAKKDIQIILNAARHTAKNQGKNLHGWFSSVPTSIFKTNDCTVHEIGVRVPTQIIRPAPAPEDLKNLWWLTGGDTDFK